MPFMSQWLVGLVSAANFQTWADLAFTHHLLMLLSQVNLFPHFLFLFSYAWLVNGVIHFFLVLLIRLELCLQLLFMWLQLKWKYYS